MAWRIVRQPNGLLARFSDVVDNFTHFNMTTPEAVGLCCEYMGRRDAALKKVNNGLRDSPGQTRYEHNNPDGLNRWRDCLETIVFRHGEDAALEAVWIGAISHQEAEQ